VVLALTTPFAKPQGVPPNSEDALLGIRGRML
jgi:hypothetical protein